MTKPVMEAMEWAEVPEWVDSAKLDGILSAQRLTLTPNQKQLKDHEIAMDTSEVSDFKIVRITENDAKKVALRFIARVVEVGAAQWVEDYIRTVGTDPGALKVSYVHQEALPLTDGPTDEQRKAVGEDED